MPSLSRRAVLAIIAASQSVGAFAQDSEFPGRPLRFVVGFPPGGPNDLLARLIAPGISERLKRPVVVENRAGANGEIACASVAKAPPDGSVFMLASNGSTTVASALNPSLSYDVRTDFAAVAGSIPCCWWCATTCRPRTCRSCWRSRASGRAS
jgi:tripartite-type tricarboxylate transporter receptor subunit TctC